MEIIILKNADRVAATGAELVEGPVSAMCPASILQMHERVTVLLDEAAASGLRNRDYYDWTYLQNESLKKRFRTFHDQ